MTVPNVLEVSNPDEPNAEPHEVTFFNTSYVIPEPLTGVHDKLTEVELVEVTVRLLGVAGTAQLLKTK